MDELEKYRLAASNWEKIAANWEKAYHDLHAGVPVVKSRMYHPWDAFFMGLILGGAVVYIGIIMGNAFGG